MKIKSSGSGWNYLALFADEDRVSFRRGIEINTSKPLAGTVETWIERRDYALALSLIQELYSGRSYTILYCTIQQQETHETIVRELCVRLPRLVRATVSYVTWLDTIPNHRHAVNLYILANKYTSWQTRSWRDYTLLWHNIKCEISSTSVWTNIIMFGKPPCTYIFYL